MVVAYRSQNIFLPCVRAVRWQHVRSRKHSLKDGHGDLAAACNHENKGQQVNSGNSWQASMTEERSKPGSPSPRQLFWQSHATFGLELGSKLCFTREKRKSGKEMPTNNSEEACLNLLLSMACLG